MKKNKIALAVLALSLGLVACVDNSVDNSSNESTSNENITESKIKAIYEQARNNGYSGTYEQWLASIKGEDGKDGKDGSNGQDGAKGADGQNGTNGTNGQDGKDAITYVPAIFYNYDGTKLYEFYYEYGSDIVYEGPTPTKEVTEDSQEITYTFNGWDKSLEDITKPTIYTATFKGPEYTCIFKNYDGSTLYTTKVERGNSAVYQGSAPTKPNDGEVIWNFTSWDKSLDNIKEDTVFTAKYYSPNGIKCTFKNYDGTELYTTYCGSGDKVTYGGVAPTKEDEEESGVITKYTFTNWDKSLKNIQADTVFTAQFSSTDYYVCTFVNYDGTELYKTSTFSGGQATYSGETPTKPQEAIGTAVTDYTFSSWDKSLSNITVPTTFTAQYTTDTFTGYKVIFKDNNDEILYSHYYEEGTTAVYPYEISFSYDSDNVYMFTGWDKSLTNISGELTVKASYLKVERNKAGEYPQSKVTDTTLISELDKITTTDAQGYKVYNNEKYYKYFSSYYKVEPIKWRYLGEKDGNPLFVSEYILDKQEYGTYYSDTQSKTDYQGNTATVYANNYKYSEIRTWLNTTFLDQAFYYDDSLIVTTVVDNSVASTGDSTNEYVCETTNDKVFLLSRQELTSSSYGFDSYESRKATLTDYAKARGAGSYYWTRSPYYFFSYYAYYVYGDGYVDYDGVYCSFGGVRPALVFSFDEN